MTKKIDWENTDWEATEYPKECSVFKIKLDWGVKVKHYGESLLLPKSVKKQYNLTNKQFDKFEELCRLTNQLNSFPKDYNKPELSRFDDTKGYVKGNVEMVCKFFYDSLEQVREV
jgi:hypothetical protein